MKSILPTFKPIVIVLFFYLILTNVSPVFAQGDVDVEATVDSENPTVTITNPSDGATVSGTVNVAANASDDGGIVKVEFYVDGFLKLTDTSTPYTFPWDTMTIGNGSHTISAKAYDIVGKTATDTITVTVNNVTMASPTKKLTPLGPVTPVPGREEKEKPRSFLVDIPAPSIGLPQAPIDFLRANSNFFFGLLFAIELLSLYFLIKGLRKRKEVDNT